jgi:hypothetical protein
MAPDAALRATFKSPFPEQVAALRLRFADLRDTQAWTDLWQAEHDRAFMVAGATKADVLEDLAQAVDRAAAEGRGLEWFRTEFRRIVETKGWHGWTGEGTAGGEAWRTRVIWQTNMATSHAAGRRAQLVKAGFRYWVYRHGGSLDPRPQHLAWDGLVLPPDHPFWATHSPPNGWGCSCYVVGANGPAGIRAVGGDPAKTLPPGWEKADPRTGAPKGIDRGFAHAPGATVAETVRALVPKLDHLPARPSIALIQEWLQLPSFAGWMRAPSGNWPLARLSDTDAEAIGAKVRIGLLSEETMLEQLREHPELTPADYALAQAAVSRPTFRVPDGPASIVFVLVDPGPERGGIVTVVKATVSGNSPFVVSLRRLSRDDAERDRTIRSLLRRAP